VLRQSPPAALVIWQVDLGGGIARLDGHFGSLRYVLCRLDRTISSRMHHGARWP
jgi:hypothetical protein